MIEHVHIQNFRSLRDVEFDLAPLTVLVGPNASGKSSILEALRPENVWNADRGDRWRHRPETIRVVWTHDDGSETIRENAPKEGKTATGKDFSWRPLRLNLERLRNSNRPGHATFLRRTGENLVNVFATLTRSEQIELADEFCNLVPVYQDIDTRPAGGQLQLRFHDRWEPDLHYDPYDVSDGTMLMLAFLILKYQHEGTDLVAVEEPERGLHPYLIEQLVTLLRNIATGESGRNQIQFVLATHSAELLEYAEPEEVRFVDRNRKTGETSVNSPPVDNPNWSKTMEAYLDSLGSAWLAGEFGGVPGK